MLTGLPLWLQDGGLLLPVPPGIQRPQTDRAHVPEELGRADLQRASPAGVPGLQVSESRVGPARRPCAPSSPAGERFTGIITI